VSVSSCVISDCVLVCGCRCVWVWVGGCVSREPPNAPQLPLPPTTISDRLSLADCAKPCRVGHRLPSPPSTYLAHTVLLSSPSAPSARESFCFSSWLSRRSHLIDIQTAVSTKFSSSSLSVTVPIRPTSCRPLSACSVVWSGARFHLVATKLS
jgi:hypothetical protein